jgi:hypothetical protein
MVNQANLPSPDETGPAPPPGPSPLYPGADWDRRVDTGPLVGRPHLLHGLYASATAVGFTVAIVIGPNAGGRPFMTMTSLVDSHLHITFPRPITIDGPLFATFGAGAVELVAFFERQPP